MGHGLPAVTVNDMFPTSKFLRSWNKPDSSNIKKFAFDFWRVVFTFFFGFFFKIAINFNASKKCQSFNKSHLKLASSQITKIRSGNLHLLWAEKWEATLSVTEKNINTYPCSLICIGFNVRRFILSYNFQRQLMKKLAMSIVIQISGWALFIFLPAPSALRLWSLHNCTAEKDD